MADNNYGFTTGKNKQGMYSKSEVDTAIEAAVSGLQGQITELLTAKQDTKVTKTATLAAASWSSKTQTVNVSGVKANNLVQVTPVPGDVYTYGNKGIRCTAQAANALTFECLSVPATDIDVNVVIWN